MRRLHLVALSSLALVSSVSALQAGDFWTRFKADWHRNNAWPQPFIAADRAAVCEYFAIQTNNGWRLQNTIGDAYFDPATQELTLAGQHKVKWIVTQAPTHRRAVFVLANESQEITQLRLASVENAVARFKLHGPPCDVLLTDRDVMGGSGEYYDAVDRALKSSVPPPRLPAATGAGGAGGNGGAGGQSAGS
jgi:hypothetical protein